MGTGKVASDPRDSHNWSGVPTSPSRHECEHMIVQICVSVSERDSVCGVWTGGLGSVEVPLQPRIRETHNIFLCRLQAKILRHPLLYPRKASLGQVTLGGC